MVNEKKAYLLLFMCTTLLLLAITVSNCDNTAAFRPMNSGGLPSPAPVPSTIPSPAPVPSTIPSPAPVPSTIPSPAPVPSTIPSPAPVPSTIPSPAPVPSTIPKSSNTLNFIDYSNSVLGIALQYPADWNIVSVKNGIQFVKEKDTSYVEIRVHEIKNDKIDLKQYVEDNIADRKKSREGFKLIDDVSQTTVAGNLEAYKATYSFSKSEDSAKGDTQKISRLWTLLGDKLYTLAYVSPPRHIRYSHLCCRWNLELHACG